MKNLGLYLRGEANFLVIDSLKSDNIPQAVKKPIGIWIFPAKWGKLQCFLKTSAIAHHFLKEIGEVTWEFCATL